MLQAHASNGSPQAPTTRKSMTPGEFDHFANIPQTFALAVAEDLHYIWYNNEYARFFERRFGTRKVASLRDTFPPRAVEERVAYWNKIVQGNAPDEYCQLFDGARRLTRVWPLDPVACGTRGWFIVCTPELTRNPDRVSLPFVHTSDMGDLAVLSPRELIALRLIAEGLNANECAEVENRSAKTIENQVAAIYHKLNLGNKSELVRFACERGLLAFTREEWAQIVGA